MSKKTKRERIIAARHLLGLGNSASLREIKKAYREKARNHHPDTADPEQEQPIEMHRLTEAYQTLLHYCADFRFPLEPDESIPETDEDWWMARFGNDPVWGRNNK